MNHWRCISYFFFNMYSISIVMSVYMRLVTVFSQKQLFRCKAHCFKSPQLWPAFFHRLASLRSWHHFFSRKWRKMWNNKKMKPNESMKLYRWWLMVDFCLFVCEAVRLLFCRWDIYWFVNMLWFWHVFYTNKRFMFFFFGEGPSDFIRDDVADSTSVHVQ